MEAPVPGPPCRKNQLACPQTQRYRSAVPSMRQNACIIPGAAAFPVAGVVASPAVGAAASPAVGAAGSPAEAGAEEASPAAAAPEAAALDGDSVTRRIPSLAGGPQ